MFKKILSLAACIIFPFFIYKETGPVTAIFSLGVMVMELDNERITSNIFKKMDSLQGQ